jgi:branched-chain amino acid transport system ATP-binding protein
VLDHGETIANGDPTQVKADPKVLAAYLGQEVVAPHGAAGAP